MPATLWEKPRTRAGKEMPIPNEVPEEAPQELLQSPVAQPVAEAIDDAVAGVGSLRLEDNLTEEAETASSSLSPDSSPVGEEAQPKVGGSPKEVDPAEDAPREGGSAEGNSGEAMALDKKHHGPLNVEVILLDEAAGGCSSSAEQFGDDVAGNGLFHAITPLSWCPHLSSVVPVPPVGLNVWEPCAECGSEMENWVCLVCYKVCCGRYINQHMLDHNKESGHPLVLSFSDLSTWCYDCEAYIHHPVLLEAKCQAHRLMFGEDMHLPS